MILLSVVLRVNDNELKVADKIMEKYDYFKE